MDVILYSNKFILVRVKATQECIETIVISPVNIFTANLFMS